MAVLIMPIDKIQELWQKLLKGKHLCIKPASLVIVFFIACSFAPSSSNPTSSKLDTKKVKQVAAINTETESQPKKVSEKESETEAETETQITSESEQTHEQQPQEQPKPQDELMNNNPVISLDAIPAYDGKAYIAINDNTPFFTDSELVTTAFENYSNLDSLGRCGVAYANVCKDIMPTEKRGEIGSVKPSGWHTVKYDVVQGKYLYNRCHLIGFQLAGENANPKNLITGTRYLNVEGMLPFENMVADYVKETGNHVLYRVTPMYSGKNLLASGVLIEAKSVEDKGAGILFNVYCYNVQPGVSINYENGDSSLDGTAPQTDNSQGEAVADSNGGSSGDSNSAESQSPAVGNQSDAGGHTDNSSNSDVMVHITETGSKYHMAGCRFLKKSDSEVTLDKAKSMGLSPCSVCNPPQ